MNRCPPHIRIAPHNLNANGDECGACIMKEVFFLYHSRLELLDTLADLLQSHAHLRQRLAERERELDRYRPNPIVRGES